MKLYATVSSERASKGQGGNEFLKIDLLGGGKVNPIDMGLIEMRMMNDGKYCQLAHFAPSGEVTIVYLGSPRFDEKGERQKSECVECKAVAILGDYCQECADNIPR